MVFFQLVPPLAWRRSLLCLFPQKFSIEASVLQSRAILPLAQSLVGLESLMLASFPLVDEMPEAGCYIKEKELI